MAVPHHLAAAQRQEAFQPLVGVDAGPAAVAEGKAARTQFEDGDIGFGADAQGAQLGPVQGLCGG